MRYALRCDGCCRFNPHPGLSPRLVSAAVRWAWPLPRDIIDRPDDWCVRRWRRVHVIIDWQAGVASHNAIPGRKVSVYGWSADSAVVVTPLTIRVRSRARVPATFEFTPDRSSDAQVEYSQNAVKWKRTYERFARWGYIALSCERSARACAWTV